VGPGLTPEQTGRHLGQLAEVVVEQSLALARHNMVAKHGQPTCQTGEEVANPGFAVIAYGKLGSLELGYTSDLDMIFLHGACAGEGVTDGPRPVANEVFFARLGQRLIHILTTRTPGGILYEVDMRLRPSGQSGPLVTNLPAFIDYQTGHAWTWEHQALVRSRAIAGDPALCRGFEEARRTLLCQARDPEKLRQDVLDMRARMRAALAPHDPDRFHLKQDPGGMIDIEFMVQYWTLQRAHDHPDLVRQRDNIHLLEALAGAGVLDAGTMQVLADAYRRYLSVEHRFKLMERQALVAPGELGDFPAKVTAIWERVFGNAGA
jgi:glutamate-ammonia-ligase adenylyltransferase